MKTHQNLAAMISTCLGLMLFAVTPVLTVQAADLGGGAGVIGNDSEGTFSRNIDDSSIQGNRFPAPVSMQITEIRAKVLPLIGIFKCAVYSDNAGEANLLLRGSEAVVDATNGWNTFPLTAPLDLVGGEFYWLVIWSDTVDARIVADITPGRTYSLGSYSYPALAGEWPDPITLTVGVGDAAERTYCIYAEGTPIGTVPGAEMDVRGNGKLIVSGDLNPSALDGTFFGTLSVGSGFQDGVFTIQNVGDSPLALTGTPRVSVLGSAAADFTVLAPPDSPVAPGGEATFTVRFDPTARGLRTAMISIVNDDSTENPYNFTVQGGGVAAGRESLFPDTKVLGDVDFDGTYYELGTVFQASVPGKVTHLRVYSLASESGDHTARLWRNSDETVIGGPYTWNYGGVTGWIEFDIPDVDIEADTDYTVSISVGTSEKRNYPNLSDLAAGGNNGLNLSYPVDAGKFTETRDARPTSSFNHGDYGRDILFVPSAPPPESLFPDTKVLGDVDFDGAYYELGTVFQASVPGKVTHLRVYSLASESGDHTARLWRNSDETVIGGPYIWNYGGVTGWIEFDIPDVDIEADTEYTVSISVGTSEKRNYPNLSDLAAGGNNGLNLSYPPDAGKFNDSATPGGRPTASFNHGDYGRDIVFVPGTDTGDATYRFEDVADDFFLLEGIHGGIDFGSGRWTGFLNIAGLSQAGVAETFPGTFTLPAGKVLKAIRLSSTSGGAWRISDGVNPELTGTFDGPNAPVSVLTGWQTAAVNVTVEIGSFAGDGFIDDIVYGDPSGLAPLQLAEIRADPATGNVSLRWTGGGDSFQVFKARSVEGPYDSVSSLLTVREFTDAGALSGDPPCGTASATGGWVNKVMANQTGGFSVQFEATPAVGSIDSVMALSSGFQTTFSSFACLARFNDQGNIDARNADAYTADNVVPYSANVKYMFRFDVDVVAHIYSVYVTPAGGVEQTVGANFAFRSEQSAIANLDHWGVIVAGPAGANTVCDFKVVGAPDAGSRAGFYRVQNR